MVQDQPTPQDEAPRHPLAGLITITADATVTRPDGNH